MAAFAPCMGRKTEGRCERWESKDRLSANRPHMGDRYARPDVDISHPLSGNSYGRDSHIREAMAWAMACGYCRTWTFKKHLGSSSHVVFYVMHPR